MLISVYFDLISIGFILSMSCDSNYRSYVLSDFVAYGNAYIDGSNIYLNANQGVGCLWNQKEYFDIVDDFSIILNAVRYDDGSDPIFDGAVIAISKVNQCIYGSVGGLLAHDGMTETIAFEYDAWKNDVFSDASVFTISIHDCTVATCSASESNGNANQALGNVGNFKNDIQFKADYTYATKQFRLSSLGSSITRHIPNFASFNQFRIGFLSAWSYDRHVRVISAYYCRRNTNRVVFTGTNGTYSFKVNQVEISSGFITAFSPITIGIDPESFDKLYEFIITKDASVTDPLFIATFYYDDEILQYKTKNTSKTWFAGFLPAIEKVFSTTVSGLIGNKAIWDINNSSKVVLTTFISKSSVSISGGSCS